MERLYLPDAREWINSFEAGQQAGMTDQKNRAVRTAGGLMTSGDYSGASAAIMPYDMQSGLAIQKMGAERESQTRRAEYGRLAAAGDHKGARDKAYAGGDWEIAKEMQEALDKASEAQRAQVKQNAATVAAIVAPLGDIADMAQRKAYIEQNREALIGAGYTAEQLAGFEPTDANLARVFTEAMGIEKYLEHRGRVADDKRADAQAAEVARHNRASEATSRASVGVSAGNLSQRRAEHAARLQGRGGYAAGASYDDLPPGAQVVR